MRDDRGVSSTLSYVLSLTIATLLITGLLLAGSGFVSDNRESVIRNELSVIGEQIASDVERVDRMVVAGDSVATAALTQEFPTTVTGSTYDVQIVPDQHPELQLRATKPSVTVDVRFTNETDVGDSAAGGGPVTVRYDGSAVVIEDG